MPSSPKSIAALRTLISARFPENRRPEGSVPTGIKALDEALAGGLPVGRLTELISTEPGTGGQTVIAQVLASTREARLRVALIDGGDGFSADDVERDALRHLIWVRPETVAQTFSVADVLLRDGNYGVVIVDLRGLAETALLRTAAATWHRLRHAAESSTAAILIQTTTPLVPAVSRRLILNRQHRLSERSSGRAGLADNLQIEVARGQVFGVEETA